MNYDKDNNDHISFDDMKIKSHLNTSLDLSGICVSEELIQKTLQAINEQPSTNPEQHENHKFTIINTIPWNRYVRGLTGVAAAALLLFVGYHIANSMGGGSSNGDMGNRKADMVREESVKHEIFYTAEDTADDSKGSSEGAGAKNDLTEFKMGTTKEAETEMDIATSEKGADQESMQEVAPMSPSQYDAGEENLSIAGGSVQAITASFEDLCSLTAEQTKRITITDEINQTSLTLTNQTDIGEFYSLMERYQYGDTTGEYDDNLYYTIEIEGNEDAYYRIQIDAAIAVEYRGGEISSMSNHSILNQEELLRELNVFISKY